jgi:hypothetical protein
MATDTLSTMTAGSLYMNWPRMRLTEYPYQEMWIMLHILNLSRGGAYTRAKPPKGVVGHKSIPSLYASPNYSKFTTHEVDK